MPQRPPQRPGYDPTQPWNELPELPPAPQLETPVVLKACIGARSALARVNALSEALPNPAILIHSIPLQEARSSSQIEDIVTTSDALYEALAAEGAASDPSAKEVLRYREALWEGMEHLAARPVLNAPAFERICSRIRGVQVRVRGAERVAIVTAARRAIYTPPAGADHIQRLLGNLERFLHDDSGGLDPLIKMAVMHYQFEAIHPFTDGNGRTGRILNLLYLVQQKLLHAPIIYLSRFFIEHREHYYQGLRGVTERADWRGWLLFMLEAVAETAQDTIGRLEDISRLAERMQEQARSSARAGRREGFVEILFKWPYCKIGIVQRELQCSRITAKRYLDEMASLGLLEQVRRGRSYYYINTQLVELLGD